MSKYKAKRENQGNPEFKPPQPLNEAQVHYMKALEAGNLVVCTGCPGTSKTYLPSALGAYWLATKQVKKVILARPNEGVGKTIGLLPGDADEKLAPLLIPTSEAMIATIGKTNFEYHRKKGNIEYCLLEYVKGRTFDDCVVIVDEAEDVDQATMKALLTRIGQNCLLVINGDIKQQSLKGNSGMHLAIQVAERMTSGGYLMDFTSDAIVRSGVCKEIVEILSQLGHY